MVFETEEERWNRRNLKRLSDKDLLRLESSVVVSPFFKGMVTAEIEKRKERRKRV